MSQPVYEHLDNERCAYTMAFLDMTFPTSQLTGAPTDHLCKISLM